MTESKDNLYVIISYFPLCHKRTFDDRAIVDLAVIGDRYAMLVMPKLDMSVRRFRLRRLMEYEDLSIGESVILFQPLQFSSGSILRSSSNIELDTIRGEFDQLSEQEQQIVLADTNRKITDVLQQRLPSGKRTRIGLVDQSDVDKDRFKILTNPFWIGPLDVVPFSSYATEYLRQNGA